MTYMSIPDDLEPLVQLGKLTCIPSSLTGFETMREVYASIDIATVVADPFSGDGAAANRIAEFRLTLDAFVEGGLFSVAEKPRSKPNDAMLARIEPPEDELWDIRCIAPKPGIRCFGGFHSKDRFIALTWNYRENIIDFDSEVDDCRKAWQSLFGIASLPFHASCLDDYLTNFFAV